MKKYFKIVLQTIIQKIFYISRSSNIFRKILDIIIAENSQSLRKISTNNSYLYFYETNSLTKYRIDTFFQKEPETLEWIDGFNKNSIFWDVGANIGLYSIYAAKTKSCNVTAFEPSVFNLNLLARNIYINSVHNNINILPIILSNKNSMGLFQNSSIVQGAALSGLMQNNNNIINPSISECEYKLPVFKLDLVSSIFNLNKPKYLKIDVDGLEYQILRGSNDILKNLHSILIEVDERDSKQTKSISQLMEIKGFYLKKEGDRSKTTVSTVNQIWEKNRV
ncbi:FkbM family methyltransferase [bacterium]|nr:FkbM family methyltransferase [bacterium]